MGAAGAAGEAARGVRSSRGAGSCVAAALPRAPPRRPRPKTPLLCAAIEFVEPDYRVPVNWLPNDSLFKAQWHHTTIGSQVAWNSSKGSAEIKVGGGGGAKGGMGACACAALHTHHTPGSLQGRGRDGATARPRPNKHAESLPPPPLLGAQVCHLDSGVRVDHPDLVGRVLTGWNLVPEVQVGFNLIY